MTIRTTLSSMIKEGGVRSLWRGNLMNVMKVSPETGIRLMSYETFKRFLGQTTTNEISVWQKFLCGSAAGFTASALVYPMKTIKVRSIAFSSADFLPLRQCPFRPVWRFVEQINTNRSPIAWWKSTVAKDFSLSTKVIHSSRRHLHRSEIVHRSLGLLPSALAILPASGIDLALYETLKRRLESYQGHPSGPIEKLVIGNISNGFSQSFIYPLLIVRTRLQSNITRSDTMTDILKRLWIHHGFRGLYNGFFLHMLRLGPASGISFLTFEYASQFLGAKAL